MDKETLAWMEDCMESVIRWRTKYDLLPTNNPPKGLFGIYCHLHLAATNCTTAVFLCKNLFNDNEELCKKYAENFRNQFERAYAAVRKLERLDNVN